MPIRNAHWYTENGTRNYPLSDAATAESADGKLLPTGILLDLNLRFPDTLGAYPFLAAVTVSARLVTLTFQCAADPDDTFTFSPMATVSLPLDTLVEGRNYPLASQYPGVGGWVVFGSGVREAFTGRFGSRAGLLSPRAARGYRPLPVENLGKLYAATPLTGLVRLSGEEPIQIVREEREIAGVVRDVAVVRLVEPGGLASTLAAGRSSVFEAFAGPCGARPESQNCGEYAPIEAINAVPPDCDGNITIVLRGCATIAKVQEECGVVVDCALGLIDACLPDGLPATDGKLRTDYDDQCNLSETSDISEVSDTPDSETSDTSDFSDASQTLLGELPQTWDFDSGMGDWITFTGNFGLVADDSPDEPTGGVDQSLSSEGGGSLARNVALWNAYDDTTLGRRYIGDVKMLVGEANGRRNAGLVINFRTHSTIATRQVYYVAEINYDTKEFRISRFNGTELVPTSAFVILPQLQLDVWYTLTVTTEAAGGENVTITAELNAVDGPAASATLTLTTSGFYPDTGRVGFHADRAESRLSYLTIEEA